MKGCGSCKSYPPVGFQLLEEKSPLEIGSYPLLAPGVLGYGIRDNGAVYIGYIAATDEGSGAVGRFLDALPLHTTFRIPNVINQRLAGMLERRGWKLKKEFDRWGEGCSIDVYERRS